MLDGIEETFDKNLGGGVGRGRASEIEEAVVAKELLVDIFSLGDAIGIDEDARAAFDSDALLLISERLEEAGGEVSLGMDIASLPVGRDKDDRVVAGIAEDHLAGVEVEATDEHSDEHIAVVSRAERAVDARDDAAGAHRQFGDIVEERARDSHIESGGDALAGDVADSEIDGAADTKEIVHIAADLLGGSKFSEKVDLVVVDKIGAEHLLLDIACYGEFVFEAEVGGSGRAELGDIIVDREEHIVDSLVEVVHLIVAVDMRDDDIKVTLSDILGEIGNLCDREERAVD